MNTLFPLEPVLPEGFHYEAGFISEAEEKALLEVIRSINLDSFQFQGYEAKRRVASFGFDYSFDAGKLVRTKPIPDEFQPLLVKIAGHLKLPVTELAELLVTEYPPGSVINWHRDAPSFEIIAGLSLLTDCQFRLRPYDEASRSRKNLHQLLVEKRSLYVMEGPARWQWQHSIAAVKHTRYSITVRTLRDKTADQPSDQGST